MDELKDVRVLIIDPSGYSKGLLRQILLQLGVGSIEPVTNTSEALEKMRLQLFDVVFCDENAAPLEPAAFIKALRLDLQTMNVTMPVVLVSSGVNFAMVAQWRDAGGSDVIVKPVSSETIRNRLVTLVLNPKSFVTAKGFIGPDRRRSGDRRQFGERPHGGEDRRRNRDEAGVIFSTPRVRAADPQSEPSPS
jgi:two-component system, chemotaxis family, chemotaxis protein CheY